MNSTLPQGRVDTQFLKNSCILHTVYAFVFRHYFVKMCAFTFHKRSTKNNEQITLTEIQVQYICNRPYSGNKIKSMVGKLEIHVGLIIKL